MYNTLNFTLKQHSPLIHFQHEQAGATLRATEVKAKLDKFIRIDFLMTKHIRSHPQKANFENTIQEFFKISEDVPDASPYQLKFSGKLIRKALMHSQTFKDYERRKAQSDINVEQPIEFLERTPYFADNEKIKNSKWGEVKLACSYENVQGRLFSFYPEIIELLSEALPLFFCYHNFGSRQSKGFGSFTVDTINNKKLAFDQSEFIRLLHLNPSWVFIKKFDVKEPATDSSIIARINSIYQPLKFKPAGPNQDISKIRDFFRDNDVEWEKTFVTPNLAKNNPQNPVNFADYDDKKYVRALLGLAEIHDYQQLKVTIKIKDKSGEIDRFQSPITFKVFENSIFLCASPVPEAIRGRVFEFSRNDNPNAKLYLSTPDEFDIKAFLEFSIKNRP